MDKRREAMREPEDEPALSAGLTVATVLERWPATVLVLLRHGTACPGCAMAPFETLEEMAAVYGLPLPALLAELQRAAVSGAAPLSGGEPGRSG